MLHFIVNRNSRSGNGTAVWEQVAEYLKKHRIEYRMYPTKYHGHAEKLARKICQLQEEDIRLVAVGGDGTINEVVNGMVNFQKVRFGVIPTGSGNDFARGLELKGMPVDHIRRIVESTGDFRIDLGQVVWNGCESPRKFAISAGIGMDAIVCERAETSRLKKILNKIHLGKLTYVLITIHTLFSMETGLAKCEIDGVHKEYPNFIFAAAMNFRAEGGGVPMAPKADSQDGKLSVCHCYSIPKAKTFFLLPVLVLAKHENIHGINIMDCRDEEIHLDVPMTLHTDGEVIGHVTDVKFECLPGKLRMMI